jgi:hypothetical protein
MTKQKIFIGIDPDCDKSGVAFQQGKIIELSNLTFFQLFDYFNFIKKNNTREVVEVYVECGFLNKSNWHKTPKGSVSLNVKIGERTGANFEVAKKICEMLEYLEMTYFKIKPTRSKVDSKFFEQVTKISRSNQEQRDAYMLIIGRK